MMTTRRPALAVIVLTLLVAAFLVVARPAPAVADGCGDANGVTVVVDFGELGGVAVGCAPGDPDNGFAALTAAGFSYAFVPRQPGFVCQINSAPNPCNGAPTNAYWSYWHGTPGGSWSYSEAGAGDRNPAPGSVEGWSFGGGSNPGMAPPARPEPDPGPQPGDDPPANEQPGPGPDQPGTDNSGVNAGESQDNTTDPGTQPGPTTVQPTPTPGITQGAVTGTSDGRAAFSNQVPISAAAEPPAGKAGSALNWVAGALIVAVLIGLTIFAVLRRRSANDSSLAGP